MKPWLKFVKAVGELPITHLAMLMGLGALGVAALAILAVARGG